MVKKMRPKQSAAGGGKNRSFSSSSSPPSPSSHRSQGRSHGILLLLLPIVCFGIYSIVMNSNMTKVVQQMLVEQRGGASYYSYDQGGGVIGGGNDHDGVLVKNNYIIPPIEQLTKSHIQDGIQCPWPLVPLYDRIVNNDEIKGPEQKITKSVHYAWIKGYYSNQSRCLSPDMLEGPKRWMEQFPSYNFYFHDDEAVEALFDQQWPEFPQLEKIMKACVRYGSAMRIDLWRVLVLYRYGGFYADFDEGPGDKFVESSVDSNDTAIVFSDAWDRPTQNIHGMEPNHPMAYFTMMEIFKRLLALEDVSTLKLVFLTGPEALKFGYWHALDPGYEVYDKAFEHRVHRGKFGKQVRKLPGGKDNYWSLSRDAKLVPYPRNSTADTGATMISLKDRIDKEMSSEHWTRTLNKKGGIPKQSCWNLLYMNDNDIQEKEET